MRWLGCSIGSTRIFVRASDIHVIVELQVAPAPPLLSHYISGIALLEDTLALAVRVGPRAVAAARTTKAIVLVTPGSPLRWVFEVDATHGFADDKRPDPLTSEPAWLTRSRGGERFLDVAGMVLALEHR
jgi:hypothetical protein